MKDIKEITDNPQNWYFKVVEYQGKKKIAFKKITNNYKTYDWN